MIWSDVWRSRDLGRSWQKLVETDTPGHWPARAYFQAVTKGNAMYVLGGQNFNLVPNPGCAFLPPGVPCDPPLVPASDFFNDVWRSENGRDWVCLTTNAGWHGRAGLSSVVFKGEIYVLGGSFNDDSSIVGGPPVRVYFNDVWKSRDGANWVPVTTNAPWAPRAGAAVVAKGGYIYLLGGRGCSSATVRLPSFVNDRCGEARPTGKAGAGTRRVALATDQIRPCAPHIVWRLPGIVGDEPLLDLCVSRVDRPWQR